MGGVEVLQAPRGLGVGRGSSPLREGSVEGAVPRKFFVSVENAIF